MESDVDWVVPYARLATAPPEPIQALTVSFEGADGTSYTALVRRWTAASASGCRLCRCCTARPGSDGQMLCVVAIEGAIPDGRGAALFSPDGLSATGRGRPADAS